MTFLVMPAEEQEYPAVRAFYHTLIDKMQGAEYPSAWIKGVYPADAFLQEAIRKKTLYVGKRNGKIIAAMVVNQDSNESYEKAHWKITVPPEEATVLHTLAVDPDQSRRGFAKRMVRQAVDVARTKACSVMRLDALSGNIPAIRLYEGLGFQYVETLSMFYDNTGWTDFLLYEYPL